MAAGVVVVVLTEDPKDRVGGGGAGRESQGRMGSGAGVRGLVWEGWGKGEGARSDCFYLRFKFRTCVSC